MPKKLWWTKICFDWDYLGQKLAIFLDLVPNQLKSLHFIFLYSWTISQPSLDFTHTRYSPQKLPSHRRDARLEYLHNFVSCFGPNIHESGLQCEFCASTTTLDPSFRALELTAHLTLKTALRPELLLLSFISKSFYLHQENETSSKL